MNVDRPGRSIRLPWQKHRDAVPDDDEAQVSRRVGRFNFLPLTVKNHFIAMLAEFVGTFLFLLFAFGGTNAVNTAPIQGQPTNLASDPAKLLFISLCFGFSLAVNAWVFFRISGGMFNPAVSIGMMVVGAVPYLRGGLIILSQLLGGMSAAAMVKALTPGGGTDIRTSLGGGTSVVQGLFIEILCTAMLVFTIFMLAAEKHKATFIAPVGIGLALFICELFAVYYTGGSLNPARSFGPAVVARSFYSYHWIYWIGPILGSLLASGFYMFIKALEYETANPGQDHDRETDSDIREMGHKPHPTYSPTPHAKPGRSMSSGLPGRSAGVVANPISTSGNTRYDGDDSRPMIDTGRGGSLP